jgi:hypothetical protein
VSRAPRSGGRAGRAPEALSAIALAVLSGAAGCGGGEVLSCGSDTECKNDRICVQGQCQDPPRIDAAAADLGLADQAAPIDLGGTADQSTAPDLRDPRDLVFIPPDGSSPAFYESDPLGALRIQTQMDGANSSEDYLMRYSPADGYDLPWNMVFASFANQGGGQPDAVMRMGWNVAGGAGAYLAGPGLFDSWERHWVAAHPQALFLRASTTSLCTGVDADSSGGACINQLGDTTRIFSGITSGGNGPPGPFILVSNQSAELFGSTARQSGFTALPDGTVRINSEAAGQLMTNGGYQLQWDPSGLRVNATVLDQVDDTDPLGTPGHAFREAYVHRFHGGCSSAANRPACDIAHEGGWYSTCSVPGVSDGLEQVCHCTLAGACSWVTK